MSKVIFSGGVPGRTITFEGGNDSKKVVVKPTSLEQVSFKHHPNVTIHAHPDTAAMINYGNPDYDFETNIETLLTF